MLKKLREMIKNKLKEVAEERLKRKLRKKIKKVIGKLVFTALAGFALVMLYKHRRLVFAAVLGKKLPISRESKCCPVFKKK